MELLNNFILFYLLIDWKKEMKINFDSGMNILEIVLNIKIIDW